MLLGAPGRTTRRKELLGAPGRTTRSKGATRGLLAVLLGARMLLGLLAVLLGAIGRYERGSWPYYTGSDRTLRGVSQFGIVCM